MVQFVAVVRGLVALAIAVLVLATLAQVALGASLASVVGGVHRPIVALFVVLMALVLGREAWTVLAARR